MLLFVRVAVAAILSSLRFQRGAPRRSRLTRLDRALWSWLSRVFDEWREALSVVKPEIVVRWNRAAFRWFWWRKSRGGRPTKEGGIVQLIKEMSRANPLWRAPRIQGELAKLGIDVAKSTVEKYMTRPRKAPSPPWRSFLKNHLDGIAAIDFFVVPTATFRVLFVFVITIHA